MPSRPRSSHRRPAFWPDATLRGHRRGQPAVDRIGLSLPFRVAVGEAEAGVVMQAQVDRRVQPVHALAPRRLAVEAHVRPEQLAVDGQIGAFPGHVVELGIARIAELRRLGQVPPWIGRPGSHRCGSRSAPPESSGKPSLRQHLRMREGSAGLTHPLVLGHPDLKHPVARAGLPGAA